MAAGCPHVKNVQLAADKSFLNPRAWACMDCGFTDSVWACLLCNNVACGRNNSRHALKHFLQTKHPIALEVNHKYVHCYLCDDYVLTDNSAGDISLVQSLLGQVASQSYTASCSRSGCVIRPAQNRFTRSESRMEAANDRAADQRYTALCHWRYSQLARAFNMWRYVVMASKSNKSTRTNKEVTKPTCKRRKRKQLLTPGMTGFRNLGNTCYMNAVLQSLSHLFLFRDCFRQLLPQCHTLSQASAPPPIPVKRVVYTRQTTVECFRHITTAPAGLVGQTTRLRTRGGKELGLNNLHGGRLLGDHTPSDESELNQCLSAEMHALMRVLWSGKWAVVTPHAVLNAVWTLIPSFHGYVQQDAQEFLCELLLVLQNELDKWPAPPSTLPFSSATFSRPFTPHQLLPSLFQGQLLSKVTYSGCGHSSSIVEPFWDLSLDFPEMFQTFSKVTSGCLPLQDLLQRFTCPELLEGKLYSCDSCNHDNKRQHARKQLLIAHPPDVLRLHLKRFYWSGRSRHKINVHVSFPLCLDVQLYCTSNIHSRSLPFTNIQPSHTPSSDVQPSTPDQQSSSDIQPSSSDLRLSLTNIQLTGNNCNGGGTGGDGGGGATGGDGRGGATGGDGGGGRSVDSNCVWYQLSSVVVHHGSGVQSGHYTAYCWNSEAESWVHCNDARIVRCMAKEMQNSQAYILFYTHVKDKSCLWDMSALAEESSSKRRKVAE